MCGQETYALATISESTQFDGYATAEYDSHNIPSFSLPQVFVVFEESVTVLRFYLAPQKYIVAIT